jgi:hypothetical protein
VSWDDEHDEEFSELMEDYPQLEPALSRAVTTDERLDAIEHRLAATERRLLTLEASGNPVLQETLRRLKGDIHE